MTEENLQLLIDLHKSNERQGPGGTEETLKALQLTGLDLTRPLKIADIGCGSGAQTLTLAKHTKGSITAVDLMPEFLDKLNQRAERAGLSARIHTQQEPMDDLTLAEASLDLLWSEGAIYIMGFESGIRYWRRFLKPGGVLAVSEISWITEERPKEIEHFWLNAYPEMNTISHKIEQLTSNGYELLGHFTLPENCWLDNYYLPLEKSIQAYLSQHQVEEAARQFIQEQLEEQALYQNNKAYYSYEFYIARKV
jgi:ubiquinone/menaquinone biosynthesis C-methylase UbiE